ncbi:hypothetical protein BBJ28_00021432, partial [Nothophytophthora sp. Chile5]
IAAIIYIGIKEIRSLYRCGCKMFWTTGWVFSHVIATLALTKQFELDVAMTVPPTRKVSGGQRKIPGALYFDAPDSRTFTKPNLLKRFVAQPLYPYGWKVSKEYVFEEEGGETWSNAVGIIATHKSEPRGSGVIYRWKVNYNDGEVAYYGCEDLMDLQLTSRCNGLNITGF